VSEGVNRKPGSKSSFFGRRHISTSGFVRSATASFSWVSCLYMRHIVRSLCICRACCLLTVSGCDVSSYAGICLCVHVSALVFIVFDKMQVTKETIFTSLIMVKSMYVLSLSHHTLIDSVFF